MQERSGVESLSAFNAQYSTFGVEYDEVVRMLRQNFTEKKAMKALYNLEQATIELAKLNRDIVDLAKEFDLQWRMGNK